MCEAYGNPFPSYTWYHNGKNISYGSIYRKSSVTTEDSGGYMCVVTNTAAGIPMTDSKTTNVTVYSFSKTGLPAPTNFKHTQHEKYKVSFSWEAPKLPDSIQLTGYVLIYTVTNAFNQRLSDSVPISPDDNSYAFNKICSYETELALCPSSEYCFELRGTYVRNEQASLTNSSNRICLDTPEYCKKT